METKQKEITVNVRVLEQVSEQRQYRSIYFYRRLSAFNFDKGPVSIKECAMNLSLQKKALNYQTKNTRSMKTII